MSPDTTKLEVADHLIARHAKSIGDLALLFNGKQNVALDTENQCRGVGEGSQTLGKIGKVRGRIRRWWVRLGVRKVCMVVGVVWRWKMRSKRRRERWRR